MVSGHSVLLEAERTLWQNSVKNQDLEERLEDIP